MAHAYPDDVEKVALFLNRERKTKVALVLAGMVLLALAALIFAQLTQRSYLPYVY